MESDLIYDVGLHTGKDAAFYLAKGFRVVGIEADPGLYRRALERFAEPIATGRMTVLNVAVAERPGPVRFFVSSRYDFWGTISDAFAQRNENGGDAPQEVVVMGAPFDQVIEEHGCPYYLKIDIEGADVLCLEGLARTSLRPRFLSFEAEFFTEEQAWEAFDLLRRMGYHDCKIVDQTRLARVVCPNPALEGHYVDQVFDHMMSGPFGDEAPGPWVPLDETWRRYRRLLRRSPMFTGGGRTRRLAVRVANGVEVLARSPHQLSWYDVHARHTSG